MSELTGVVDPDVPQPAPVAAVPETPPAPVVPPDEDDHPEAVEVQPGVRMVPLGALKQVRDELKQLKPLAQKAQELEQQVNAFRPYAQFLQQNPHVLQQPQQAPAPVPTSENPALVEYAKRFDLYTPDGRPDVNRAQAIIEDNRKIAREEAQAIIEPVQNVTYEQRAAQNIQHILNTTKVAGKPIEQQFLIAATKTITQAMPKSEAMRILADPTVANVLRMTAMGLQAEAMGIQAPTTPAPVGAPLHLETSGGGSTYELSDSSKRLAQQAGIKETDMVDRMKRYVPNKSNVLE